MSLPTVHGEFRVVEDPELRFSPSGMAIGTIRLVANSRKKNDAGEWVDDKVVWIRATAFKSLAENMVETLQKGDLCNAAGRLQTNQWETQEGEKKSVTEMVLDSIAPSLAYRSARIDRTQRQQAGSGGSQPSGGGQPQSTPGAPAEDPWARQSQSDEPPF